MATEQDTDVADDETHEPEIDPAVVARRRAALARITKFGEPVLRNEARRVEIFDDRLRAEIGRMGLLMDEAWGIGLAAPQVANPQRLLVYRVEPDSPVNALVNPVLEWASKETETAEEGCLSLPAVGVDVERPVFVRVSAQDGHGEPILVEASGLQARVVLHEMDHLDGVLILDRCPRDQRKSAMRALREALDA